MNIIDKTLRALSPQMALKRTVARQKLEVLNYGYSEGGASAVKKSLKGWVGRSKSPKQDIFDNLDLLRQRSRLLCMTAPIATSAIKTTRTNVVGCGLKLKSKIDYKTLGISQEEASKWEEHAEKEFSLWAESKFCDSTRVNNFYEMQQLALISWLMNGDGFALIKHQKAKKYFPYALNIFLIEADRVSTPDDYYASELENNTKIYNGVEVNKDGAIVAYHVSNNYLNEYAPTEWKKISAYGKKTGQPNILHLMESERCEQYRGVPYLAPVIESLKQITRYTEAELTAAVVTAFFTAFIKQEGPSSERAFGEQILPEDRVDDIDPNSYEMGPGAINMLGVGEDVVIADPKRPASGFDGFVTAIIKQVGASLEIPYELLTKSFLSSYSASRAALLEAWKAFKMRRTWFSNDFCQPIYELWLAEAVAIGRIKAPNFFVDPLIRKAWSKAEWIGPAPGQIDPVKEVNAASLRVANGFSTREKETTELTGGNYDDNVAQLIRENELLNSANRNKEAGEV